MVELKVRLPPFASRSIAEGPARAGIGSMLRSSIACHKADERGIDGKLCPEPKRQTTSMRRASWTGTSMFIAESATLWPTRAQASWQTQAIAQDVVVYVRM